MSEIVVRPMTIADGEAVSELACELGYEVTLREAYERIGAFDADGQAVAFVALIAGEIAGWIQAHDRRLLQYPRVLEIGGMVVSEAHRGAGVGKRLLDAITTWAKARGHTELFVRSNVTRDVAHDFYLSQGFQRFRTSHTYSKAIE